MTQREINEFIERLHADHVRDLQRQLPEPIPTVHRRSETVDADWVREALVNKPPDAA